jgi:hypothetical protein
VTTLKTASGSARSISRPRLGARGCPPADGAVAARSSARTSTTAVSSASRMAPTWPPSPTPCPRRHSPSPASSCRSGAGGGSVAVEPSRSAGWLSRSGPPRSACTLRPCWPTPDAGGPRRPSDDRQCLGPVGPARRRGLRRRPPGVDRGDVREATLAELTPPRDRRDRRPASSTATDGSSRPTCATGSSPRTRRRWPASRDDRRRRRIVKGRALLGALRTGVTDPRHDVATAEAVVEVDRRVGRRAEAAGPRLHRDRPLLDRDSRSGPPAGKAGFGTISTPAVARSSVPRSTSERTSSLPDPPIPAQR